MTASSEDMLDGLGDNQTSFSNGTDTVDIVAIEVATQEKLIWVLSCTAAILFFFMLATLAHVRKVMGSAKVKKKLRIKKEEKRKAKEEKNINKIHKDPINAADFLKEAQHRQKKGTFVWEFKAINRKAVEETCDAALLPVNQHKNNSENVLPYENCRVVLDCLPGIPGSDYINASYIDSFNHPKAYIAAQGPSRVTVADFWRMIWQVKCPCIVMATNLFEHARQQCEKYWHNQHAKYCDIHVWLENSDILADFSIRTFRVRREDTGEERTIKQFQFASWSNHDVPNPGTVLEYRRRVRAFMRHKSGPIVVHCGAGGGRTGAFIALDAMLQRLDSVKTVDIFNYVSYLRSCRQNLVKNLKQYDFIYNCVALYMQCGETVITAKELPFMVQKLAIKNPRSNTTGFEKELKTLQTVVPKLTVGECAGGHRVENRRKSRDVMVQPPERARPYLITHDSNDSTDYINATYVDGYRHSNAYIVTQWPLKGTVNDIWRLIYDYNIPSMVMLNDMDFSRSYPCFWPSEPDVETTYGPLTVELLDEEQDENITTRLFRIRKIESIIYSSVKKAVAKMGTTLVSLQAMSNSQEESSKIVRVFQIRSWPNNRRVPQTSSALIELLTRVEDWQLNQCHGRIPIVVMSKNGVSRCGIYCSVSIAWDKLKTEGEVDIFRAVKTVKTNRPVLVENVVEYIYCYKFLVILLHILMSTHPHMLPSVEPLPDYQPPDTPTMITPPDTPKASDNNGRRGICCCRPSEKYLEQEMIRDLCAHARRPPDDALSQVTVLTP